MCLQAPRKPHRMLTRRQFLKRSREFKSALEKVKQDNPPEEYTWYGYDILSNAEVIASLVKQSGRKDFFGRLDGNRVADIGAADGDLAYFFESLGARVDILDYAPTNWNGLRGAKALKERLDSSVDIHEIDLDSQFDLPSDRYEVVLLLGILYHLKNPYYVLEKLGGVTQHLFLTTRIVRHPHRDGPDLDKVPMAYLVGPEECNNDATNFWMFTYGGLLQLVSRTGWKVLAADRYGDTVHSNPQDLDRDERAVMFLERAAAG